MCCAAGRVDGCLVHQLAAIDAELTALAEPLLQRQVDIAAALAQIHARREKLRGLLQVHSLIARVCGVLYRALHNKAYWYWLGWLMPRVNTCHGIERLGMLEQAVARDAVEPLPSGLRMCNYLAACASRLSR